MTEVRRFVIGGEQQGYALCHPRFADYVRRRVGPRALQTYTEALLAYCVNWREHRSPYAFRYATAHLLEAERWQELLDLVDKPFLRAKVQRLRSYGGALEDLRNGVQATRAVHDPAKMLGLALAHAGLQAKVVQLAAYDMVAEPTERMRLRRDILKSMLAAGDTTLWEEAVVRSLDFEEATFRTFDWFGQSALKLQQEDKTFPPRLLDVIDWAEQLMRV